MPSTPRKPLKVVPPTSSNNSEGASLLPNSFTIDTPPPQLVNAEVAPLTIPQGGSGPDQWQDKPSAGLPAEPGITSWPAVDTAPSVAPASAEQLPTAPQPLPAPSPITHHPSPTSYGPEVTQPHPPLGVNEQPSSQVTANEPSSAPNREPLEQIFDPDHKPHSLSPQQLPPTPTPQPEPSTEITPTQPMPVAAPIEAAPPPPPVEATEIPPHPEKISPITNELVPPAVGETTVAPPPVTPGQPTKSASELADTETSSNTPPATLDPTHSHPPNLRHRVGRAILSFGKGDGSRNPATWQGHADMRQLKREQKGKAA